MWLSMSGERSSCFRVSHVFEFWRVRVSFGIERSGRKGMRGVFDGVQTRMLTCAESHLQNCTCRQRRKSRKTTRIVEHIAERNESTYLNNISRTPNWLQHQPTNRSNTHKHRSLAPTNKICTRPTQNKPTSRRNQGGRRGKKEDILLTSLQT